MTIDECLLTDSLRNSDHEMVAKLIKRHSTSKRLYTYILMAIDSGEYTPDYSMLKSLLSYSRHSVQYLGAEFMQFIKPEHFDQAIPLLLKITKDKSPSMRSAALLSLSSIAADDPRVYTASISLINDTKVTWAALIALGRIGGRHPEILPLLLQYEDHKDFLIRWHLAEALSAYRPATPEIIRVLTKLSTDVCPVYSAAKDGLKQIQAELGAAKFKELQGS